jgi:signal peptidase II
MGTLAGANHYMSKLTRLVLVATILLGCVGCDQATKGAARAYLSHAPTASYFHDTVRLTYAENPGAFLSVGASLPQATRVAAFQGLVGILTLALIASALFWKRLTKLQILALTLLGASGSGNLIDRLLYSGYVTDFLNLGVGPVRTGIFNVADVVGVVGVVILLFGNASRNTAPMPI